MVAFAEAGKLDGLKQLTIEKNLEGQKCFSRFSLFFDCHVILLRPYRAPLRFALRTAGNIVPVWQEFYVTSLLEGGLLVRGESRPHVLAHVSFFWSGRNQLFLEKAFFVGMMRHTASIRMPGGANLPIWARGIWN